MKPVMVRLPPDLERGIQWVARRERLSKPAEAHRRLLRIGLERDIGLRYERAEISIREVAQLLGVHVRDALEIMWQNGIKGSFDLDVELKCYESARSLARARRRRRRSTS